jgi:hypothetical protein
VRACGAASRLRGTNREPAAERLQKKARKMSEQPSDPAAVVWNWRRGTADEAAARAGEAAAARKRGLIGLGVGLLVAALFAWRGRPVAAAVVAAVALAVAAVALAAPLTLFKRLSAALDAFARGVGTAVTWALMALLYYLAFLPLGLLLRATGKLAITRSFDRSRPSYWTATGDRARGAESYRKQF